MATLLYNPRPSLRPSRALSTLLADMLRDQPNNISTPSAFTPATDILETATGFELHLALPGVKKEAVSIAFLDGQLVVSGSRPCPVPAAKAAAEAPAAPAFRRLETAYGPFTRSFRLPATVNGKAIEAELTDGLLRLTLPFDTEKATKQHIEIR